MTTIFFGSTRTSKRGNVLSIKTSEGEYEPMKPSDLRVYASGINTPLWAMTWSLIGLIVAILSFPRYVFAPTTTTGLPANPPTSYLPFRLPGMAIAIKKGKEASAPLTKVLLDNSCTSMSFQGRTVWLTQNGTKQLYLSILNFEEVDESAAVPARYLNPNAFRSLLTIMAATTRICSAFHYIGGATGAIDVALQTKVSKVGNKWISADEYLQTPLDAVIADKPEVEFVTPKAYLLEGQDSTLSKLISIVGSNTAGVASSNSAVVTNSLETVPQPFITSGDSSKITLGGFIAKYSEELALPDVNFITDILGRHFISLLGTNDTNQSEELLEIKRGLGNLRLTSIGSELTHLFKCLEICIVSNRGCVPFFTDSIYEGCVIMGGSNSKRLYLQDKLVPFSRATDLKARFLTISDHVSSLTFIMDLVHPVLAGTPRILPDSMFDLRSLCLAAKLTPDQQDAIRRRAVFLNFKVKPWAITTASLNKFARVISGHDQLDATYPVSRMVLFNRDMVQVAMGCFGETECPSWDIPSGLSCSWEKANPPIPSVPVRGSKGKGPGGNGDASWVMTIRKTDFMSAVEEFNRMALTMRYRTVSTKEARDSGYVVVSRERMIEFWKEMRGALKVVNPVAVLEGETTSGVKRAAEGSPDTLAASPPGGVPGKRLKF